jgi:hypothetical protein
MLEGWRRKIQGFSKEEWRRCGGPSEAHDRDGPSYSIARSRDIAIASPWAYDVTHPTLWKLFNEEGFT